MPPAYEVLLLNTAIPQIQAAQSGDTYVVPRDIAINATAIISANSATDALRITQTGAGNALVVEDSANPDSTPFVVTAAGDVGVGATNPARKLEVVGTIRTSDGTNGLDFLANIDGGYVGTNTSKPLRIATNNTEIARFDVAGNLGLGVPPSLWSSSWKALEQSGVSLASSSVIGIVGQNWYVNNSGTDIYITTAAASIYKQTAGAHSWHTAPSGTAGNPISFTQAMTLDASGYLLVGATSSVGAGTARLQVGSTSQTAAGTLLQSGSTHLTLYAASTANAYVSYAIGSNLLFGNAPADGSSFTESARITSIGGFETRPAANGHAVFNEDGVDADFRVESDTDTHCLFVDASTDRVGIGTNAPSRKLQVSDTTTNPFISILGAASNNGGLLFGDNASDAAGQVRYDHSVDAMYFVTAGGEKARITSGGDFLVGDNATSAYFDSRANFYSPSTYGAFGGKQGGAAGSTVGVFWHTATTGDNSFSLFVTEGSGSQVVRGSITYNRTGGLVAYNTTSDYRAKDILGPVANSGATIDALKVYEGKMKGATQSRPMLVAHEAQEHAPYAVTGEKDAVNEDGTPKYQQMDVSSLVPLLLAEIQSLRARVKALEGA